MNQLKRICREGVVSEVIAERHSCKVTFPDRNNMVSAELPVLTLFAYNDKSYALPEVGSRVVVLSASNDLQSGGGYVIGSLYTNENKPVENDESIYKVETADGFSMSYDKTSKEFELKFFDGSTIKHTEDGDLEIDIKGNVFMNVSKKLEVEVKEDINAESSGDINMTGSNIRLN